MATRDRLLAAALLPLLALLAWTGWNSLGWRMVHDPPLFLYQGFLIDRLAWVPYRDFWDNNPPGTQILNWAIVHVLGTSDLSLRIADLALMGTTMVATFVALRPLSPHAGALAALVWGLVHLTGGPGFQRDDVVTLSLSLCLAVCMPSRSWGAPAQAAMSGALLTCAAMVKPPALVALPCLVVALAMRAPSGPEGGHGSWRKTARLTLFAAAGGAPVVLAVVASLWWTGSLDPFLEIARRDWPLYTRLSGGLATIQSPLFNLYSGYRKFGRLQAWLVPALAGLAIGWMAVRRDADRRRHVGLLVGLSLALLAYVGIQGKFFVYHWEPFRYCLVLLASLLLVEPAPERGALARGLGPLAAAAFALWASTPARVGWGAELQSRYAAPPKGGRVDEIAGYLKAHLRPGDTVQPLDWTGGALHAMLIAEAVPATPYLYDYVFYHHVSDNYVADLRGRFLEALRSARPRFVVEIDADDKPWVRGKDTTRDFNKLRRLLEQSYEVRERRNGYVLYERRP